MPEVNIWAYFHNCMQEETLIRNAKAETTRETIAMSDNVKITPQNFTMKKNQEVVIGGSGTMTNSNSK